MALKFWQRTSFWTKVTISFNIILTALQAVLIASQAEHIWNYISIGGQIFGNLSALWTEDKNKNDKPDIFEDEVEVTSTTTTTFKKDEPPVSNTETVIDIKPKTE
jgi:hypothetical protein